MFKQAITTDKAPKAIGPYSQAIRFQNILYLSGQIPIDPETQMIVNGRIEVQAAQVFENLRQVCLAAGGNLDQILKVSIYLVDLNDFSKVNEVMSQYFKEPYPARVCMEVRGLPKNTQIEVEAIMGCKT